MAEPNVQATNRLLAQAIKRLEKLALPQGPQIQRAAHRIGMLMEIKVKESIVNKHVIDNGILFNSIKYSVSSDANSVSITVGSYGVRYALIQEFGGVIRPFNRQFLTIPANPWAKNRRAKDFKLIRIKNMLVETGRLKALGNSPDLRSAVAFWLARQAVIPARHYMRDGVNAAVPRIIEILRALAKEGENS